MNYTADFIRNFVAKARQERYLALACKPARRRDFVWDLAHDGRHLAPEYMQRLAADASSLDAVTKRLKQLGVRETCFVLAATHLDCDNQVTLTTAALAAVVGKACDAILFFPVVNLAYYENHEGEQYLLRRLVSQKTN